MSAGVDPAATDRKSLARRRIHIVVVISFLLFAGLAWVWWNAPHRELGAALDSVPLPPGLVHLGDERQGDRVCLFDSCPRLTRYYGSALEPEELCRVVEEQVTDFDPVNVGASGPACRFQVANGPAGYAIFLTVRSPITEIPPDNENELITSVPVAIPHASVLYTRTRR